jgi:hypothetical protein
MHEVRRVSTIAEVRREKLLLWQVYETRERLAICRMPGAWFGTRTTMNPTASEPARLPLEVLWAVAVFA